MRHQYASKNRGTGRGLPSHFYRAQPGFHREGSRKFRTTLIQVSAATETGWAAGDCEVVGLGRGLGLL